MPQRLRLLKVGPEGYTVGTGESRKANQVTISHEALVAVLAGLADPKFALTNAIAGDTINANALADAANFAKRQTAGVAWALGVCSWDNQFKAIPRDGNPFHQSD